MREAGPSSSVRAVRYGAGAAEGRWVSLMKSSVPVRIRLNKYRKLDLAAPRRALTGLGLPEGRTNGGQSVTGRNGNGRA
jgi:hypothetical protein